MAAEVGSPLCSALRRPWATASIIATAPSGPRGIDRDLFAQHAARIVAANAGRERQQLAQLDLGLGRIGKRKRLGRQVRRLKDLLIEAVGKQLRPLGHQDADGDAGERFAARGEVGRRVAMGQAEILFIDQPAVADDEDAAVLGAGLRDGERLVELGNVDSGNAAGLVGRCGRSPAALRCRAAENRCLAAGRGDCGSDGRTRLIVILRERRVKHRIVRCAVESERDTSDCGP